MRYEFSAIVTSGYLVRAVALYRSLEAVCPDFGLRIFCMDAKAKDVLDRMALPSIATIAIEELEAHDQALRSVRRDRSYGEYCWTAMPASTLFALEREPGLEMLTYLDADMMFFHDPAPLFDELGSGSIGITPHRFPPGSEAEERLVGIYVNQFTPFRRDESGLGALRWWRARCLEWCYDRFEAGKFGDQKYLDDWPERFPGVRVLQHPGGGLGPWNSANHALEVSQGRVVVDGEPLIFYHYGGLRLYRAWPAWLPRWRRTARHFRRAEQSPDFYWATPYAISAHERKLVWEPYIRLLAESLAEVRRWEPDFSTGFVNLTAADIAFQTVRSLVPHPVRRFVMRPMPEPLYNVVRRHYRRQ